jgi:hypothetical protein
VTEIRLLTPQEAAIVAQATELWLRLREVEFNPAEQGATLLSTALLRSDTCRRRDIATLGCTLLLQPDCGGGVVELALVLPADQDLKRGHVSILSPLGLACLGQVNGNVMQLPHGSARLVGLKQGGLLEEGCAPLGDLLCRSI